MADIYHALLNYELKRLDAHELQEYRDTCSLAAQSITDALRLIGNLIFEASQSEEYTAEEARKDFYLAGSALRDLPRIAQALEQNSQQATHELSRKESNQ